MGIKGLLKNVLCQFVHKKVAVRDITLAGKTRAVVELSSWEHILATSIAIAVFENNRTEAIRRARSFFQKRIALLFSEGITHLHFVLDGAALPEKKPDL